MYSALTPPNTDPTPIFEHFRGVFATELLTAAVAHLGYFEQLALEPKAYHQLRAELQLADRPFTVLTTALRAMGLVECDTHRRLCLTPLAREHLLAQASFEVTGYIGLAAESPGVLAMVERLRSNRPAGAAAAEQPGPDADGPGVAFIYRQGETSAMEQEATARQLTMSLAGRARNVAPHLAAAAPLEHSRLLLDIGGGSGIYSIACLQRHAHLRAIVWDRPEVLKVAAEMADAHGVADRLICQPGDMFMDPVPANVDAILLSNILHDWDVPECQSLLSRCAAALPTGGQLFIHDVLLNDELDGPLPIALYSAALFSLTEGRAYSEAEYRGWLADAALTPIATIPTLVHCSLLVSTR